jgi:hypothetical protein
MLTSKVRSSFDIIKLKTISFSLFLKSKINGFISSDKKDKLSIGNIFSSRKL